MLDLFRYFLNSIGFLSDLCSHRNYLAINVLKKYFSVEVCISIVVGEAYDQRVRAIFVRLLLTLCVDSDPFIPICIPSKIRSLNEIKNSTEISRKSEASEDLTKFKDLLEFLGDFLGSQTIFHVNLANSNLVAELILLLKKMLELGLIFETQQLSRLSRNMLNVLRQAQRACEKLRQKRGELQSLKFDRAGKKDSRANKLHEES